MSCNESLVTIEPRTLSDSELAAWWRWLALVRFEVWKRHRTNLAYQRLVTARVEAAEWSELAGEFAGSDFFGRVQRWERKAIAREVRDLDVA